MTDKTDFQTQFDAFVETVENFEREHGKGKVADMLRVVFGLADEAVAAQDERAVDAACYEVVSTNPTRH